MKVFNVKHLSKTVGDKILFEDLSFSINQGDRIGLIGVNGSGKTTLLNMIAGKDMADHAIIESPNDYSVIYLEQQLDVNDSEPVIQYIFRNDSPQFLLLREYEAVSEALKNDVANEKLQNQLYALQERIDAANTWDIHATATSLLNKLGITNPQVTMNTLSGGQKKRVALAKVLIEKPDLLILDEPTNHLDYQMIEWLQKFLCDFPNAIIFVTHDRYFLDACSTKIWELADSLNDLGSSFGSKKMIKEYRGNYEQYLEIKAIQEEIDVKAAHKLKSLFKSELAWIKKSPQARSTKQKARIQRFESIQKEYLVKQEKGTLEVETATSRLGKKVIEARAISKRFGEKLLIHDFSTILKKGDRIGILGENGVGKTTLVNVLTGRLAPDSGEIEVGTTVKVAYFSQEMNELPENKRVLQYLQEAAEMFVLKDGSKVSVSQMLERFLFPPHSHGTFIGRLSGGERKRLYLLKLLLENPNVLFLDEPTNDLDIPTLAVLEDYLENFPGVVITVSHDRYFLDKVTDKLWVFEGEGLIKVYYGAVSDFLLWQKEQEKLKPATHATSLPPHMDIAEKILPKQKKRMSYHEKKEWEGIDEAIAKTEAELAIVKEKLNHSGSDFMLAAELMEMEAELNEKLENLIERWSYLSEFDE